jgi:hypothetical protein
VRQTPGKSIEGSDRPPEFVGMAISAIWSWRGRGLTPSTGNGKRRIGQPMV